MKALAAGKHDLLEKPSANTAEDTQDVCVRLRETSGPLGSLPLPVGPITHVL
jgi:predicted dehydrogenase